MERKGFWFINVFILVSFLMPCYAYKNEDQKDNVVKARSVFLRALKERDDSKRDKLLKEFVSFKSAAVYYIISELDWKNPSYLNMFENLVPKLSRYAEDHFLAILGDTSEYKVSIAARWLGIMKSKKAVVPLLILLGDSRPSVRASAAFALGEIGNNVAVGYLARLLTDSIPSVRRNAACAVGKLKGKVLIRELVALLADSVYSVAYTASYALKRINDPKTVDLLLELLPNSDGVFRYHIIETLGYFADEHALPVLLTLLESSSPIERGIVCEALSYYRGNFRAANALKKSLLDPSAFVRVEAKNALLRIRGD